MRVIELNAQNWRTVIDFYDALKEALGSCPGHGDSTDAWIDSMIYGGMNEIEAPYVIRIAGTASCGDHLKAEILELADSIRDARAWKLEHHGQDIDISFKIEP